MSDAHLIMGDDHFKLIEDDPSVNILDELLALHHKYQSPFMKFVNYYKEVPIVADAEILYAFDNTLSCRTTPAQVKAIQHNKHTILRSSRLRHDIYATANYRTETDEVELADFAYVEVMPDRRASIRVKMGTPLTVMVEAGTEQIPGRMRDLSLLGCAIDIADASMLGNYSYFYLNMDLPFLTFKGKSNTRIMAKLIRTEEVRKGVRCIMLFEHDKTTEDQIGRLLAQRQGEIIRELK